MWQLIDTKLGFKQWCPLLNTEYGSSAELSVTYKIAFSNNNLSCSLHFTYGIRQLMFMTSMFPMLLLPPVALKGIYVIVEVRAEAVD